MWSFAGAGDAAATGAAAMLTRRKAAAARARMVRCIVVLLDLWDWAVQEV
jgi:hypothetical protein